jgi:hypothetical protein
VVFFSRSWAEAEGYTASKPFLEYQGEKLKERRQVHSFFFSDSSLYAVNLELA